jgi:hypothetical protein
MPEVLTPGEVAKEVQEHLRHSSHNDPLHTHNRALAIAEALLLSMVTILTAYVGYQAALWNTESRNVSTESMNVRAAASRSLQQAEASAAMRLAARLMPADYKVSFGAWLATNPLRNPGAPAGPAYVPQNRQAHKVEWAIGQDEAQHLSMVAAWNAHVADHYVRITVVLAAALFLAAVSRQFGYRRVRYSVDIGALIVLLYGGYLLSLLPAAKLA